MTALEQALAISGGIFVVMMASQYGDRDYSWHKIVFPLLSVAGFGWWYLKDAPTSGVDLVVYGVGAAIGLVFGLAATAATRVYRRADGEPRTRCGLVFAGVWLAAIAVRVGFILLAEHNGSFREHLGSFMLSHQIVEGTIAPFFLLMALTTVVSRVALINVRVRYARPAMAPLPIASAAPTAPTTPAPVAA